MSSGTRRRLLLLALVLLLAAPLTVLLSRLFGDLAGDLVAGPFLYVLWLGRLLVRSIPQALFWIAFLLFGLLIAVRSLIRRRKGARTTGPVGKTHQGRVQSLAAHIRFAERSRYFEGRLAERLAKLAVEALTYAEGRTPEQVRQSLEQSGAPPELRACVETRRKLVPSSPPVGLLARLRGRTRTGSLYPDLEKIVQFLEDRLEVQR